MNVAGFALLLAAIIFFVRRYFRGRRERTAARSAGPYGHLGDEAPQMPALPRMGLRSWHESILWGSGGNTRTHSPNTLSTSDVLATPTRWRDRVRSTFSNNSAAHSDPFNLDSANVGEKATSPSRFNTFHSLPGSVPAFQAPEPVFLEERAASSDFPAREATPWTKGETTKGKNQMRKLPKLPTSANEMAFQRELERQGFGGSIRSLPRADAAGIVLDPALRRNSDVSSEPPRWRTAVSWVRDQGERVGNRMSIYSKASSK